MKNPLTKSYQLFKKKSCKPEHNEYIGDEHTGPGYGITELSKTLKVRLKYTESTTLLDLARCFSINDKNKFYIITK